MENTTSKFVGRLGPNGIEKMEPISLPRLTKVYNVDGFNGDCYGAIIDDPKEKTHQRCVALSESNPRFFYIDTYARPLSKRFGIGTYYLDDLSKADEETVKRFIALAEDAEQRKAEKDRILAEKNKQERLELPAKFPFLIPLREVERKDETKACIANLRLHLKNDFPGVKFSVRKEHYDCINVSWNDGPTKASVEKILMKYTDHCLDHSGDYMDYSPSNFNDVFGGVKHVFARRDMSTEIKNLLQSWAKSCEEEGQLYGCRNADNLVYSLFNSSDIYGEVSLEKISPTPEFCTYEPASFWRIVSTKK